MNIDDLKDCLSSDDKLLSFILSAAEDFMKDAPDNLTMQDIVCSCYVNGVLLALMVLETLDALSDAGEVVMETLMANLKEQSNIVKFKPENFN